jgi:hypoxanthine phosphoribosyltransferase
MKRIYYTWRDVENFTQEIIRQIHNDSWRPDYVVGITRGGLVPANLISQYLGVRMETLKVSLRDGSESESNLWMAEDAFGYVPKDEQLLAEFDYSINAKNILIVDDINDTGATLNWIQQDWPSGCLPHAPAWNDIWHDSVRFAVMVDNLSSGFQDVDYCGTEINKQETPCWIVFPWENWWEN